MLDRNCKKWFCGDHHYGVKGRAKLVGYIAVEYCYKLLLLCKIIEILFSFILKCIFAFSEEVILAEERTTLEEKMHIMEGNLYFLSWFFILALFFVDYVLYFIKNKVLLFIFLSINATIFTSLMKI